MGNYDLVWGDWHWYSSLTLLAGYAAWGSGSHAGGLLTMVSRDMCVVVGRGGGLQIRRGEARRYAGFETLWGPSAHLSPSQRLLGDWAGAGIGIVGLPFAYAYKRVCV